MILSIAVVGSKVLRWEDRKLVQGQHIQELHI